MKTETQFEHIEVDASDKSALYQAAKDGYTQHGVCRDLRSGHTSYVKLRRPVRNVKDKS